MSKSDFFVVITIILAIVALFSEHNRKFHLMKFSLVNKIVGTFIFIIIHLFVWSEKWTCWKGSIFDIYWCPLPSTYAYILFILLLLFFIWKIGFAAFPLENHPKLLKEYIRLLGEGKISLLASLIEKYHFKSILSFLGNRNELKKKERQEMNQRQNEAIKILEEKKAQKQKNEKTMESHVVTEDNLDIQEAALRLGEIWYPDIHNNYIVALSNQKKDNPQYQLAEDIFEKVVRNKRFISYVVSYNPIYFCPFIYLMNEKNDEFVKDVLEALMKGKIDKFFEEVSELYKFEIDGSFSIDQDDFPLLSSLFADPNIAFVNSVWFPIAEEALIELREEKEKDVSYLHYEKPDNEYSTNTLYSKSKIFVAILFLDCMGKFFIFDSKIEFCWDVYYANFTRMLLDIMKPLNRSVRITVEKDSYEEEPDAGCLNEKTIAFDLIKKIIESINDMHDVAVERNSPYTSFFENCKSRQIEIISNTDKLCASTKEELIADLS